MDVTPTVDHACLIVHGPDRAGLVAAITNMVKDLGANIVSLDQYSDDPEGGNFFQRLVFHRENLSANFHAIEATVASVLDPMAEMNWVLSDQSKPKRMAILASTSDHCLLDLLWRHRRGELPVTIPMVISNHTNTSEDVKFFNVPFIHIPSSGPDKSAAEAEIVKRLKGNVDFVVLARYMQILSEDFLEKIDVPVINIHHSFLPAFIGASPYRKAKERGVKLIGATSHYVTGDLDEGPIIEQDVIRVTHEDSAAELQRRGANVERAVLSRAVLWHAQDRVIRHGNHTIVFA